MSEILSKFRRMPYLISTCGCAGCNRPAKFVGKIAPFQKLCERHMQMLCAGEDFMNRLKAQEQPAFNLDQVGELDDDGNAAGPGDLPSDSGTKH